MKAEMFQVGDIIDQFAGSQTGIMFDIIDEMGMLFFVVDESQVQQYKLGGHYDFWCTSYNDTVAFFAVKLRDNPWHSAPYSPHLSPNDTFNTYPEGKGMALTVVLVSNKNGEVKGIDFMVLGNTFSNNIMMICNNIQENEFNPDLHQAVVQAVYQKFQTDDELVQEPGTRYSID